MTEGQNGAPEKNECKITESMSNSTTTIVAQEVPIKCGQLFGPFSDPLQWLAFKYTRTMNSEVIERRALELFKNIEVAKHSDEQNMEVVLRNGQFYFKALQNITGHSNSKLMAWFCEDLNIRLPQPSSSTVNGSKRYFCGLCNEVFLYPNLVVIHVLFSCSKRHEIIPSNLTVTTPSRPPVTQMPPPERKKRSFDIASLVNDDVKETQHKIKNGFDSQKSKMSAFQPPIVTTSSSSIPLTDQTRMVSSLMSSLPQVSTTAFATNNHMPSAFRKVDKTSSHLTTSTGNAGEATANYDTFAAFYGNTRGMPVPSVFTGTHTGYPTSLSNTLPPLPSLPTPSNAAMPTSATGSSSNKTIIPPSLLPFLPPSLAALSFPQTNWCAKCNATFRMTSDLVYHMRSHHKNVTPNDPMKKKREEKLRCNICGESFRERHHLTRHMTSHQ
ncbi:uncharacterized protein B4U80_08629 [Leptotrombidium deliense]|uniref:C2H2-type domain-containing protein n=1 Tax=Leptotrombidium deliense TaxID=299467 RepID=A0A443SQY2_9ACAR|nr:uncharacterized protein B4U80_08629 [Leptotrombidium deliense]